MEQLPVFIPALFIVTTFLTIYFLFRATHYSKGVLFIVLAWVAFQSILALSGFFTVTEAMPPRFLLLILPPLLLVIYLLSSSKGQQFIDGLNIKMLTLLHVVRIPVEVGILFLFIHKAMPQLMTFEGRNFDILSGITAPLVYYYAFIKNKLGVRALLAWNFICLALLFWIVGNAILSAPTPIQQFAFDQPNIAVLYFPYVWLPGVIVPIVLFSHLAAIRKLIIDVRAVESFIATK
jgi:hypothetical protein